MNDEQLLVYVQAAAALMELPLDDAQARQVAQHLARTAVMARMLDGVPLALGDEIAQVYCPAPFPPDAAA